MTEGFSPSGNLAEPVATFHYLAIRAFAHETEDPAKVKAALANVAHGAEISLEETVVDGSHKNQIRIFEGELKNANAAKSLFAQLSKDDPRGYAQLRAESDKRLDEHLNYYLRLDKQDAFLGRMRIAQDEDAITIRGKIRSFEAKRSGSPLVAAREELDRFFASVDATAARETQREALDRNVTP